jgi:TonB family protein
MKVTGSLQVAVALFAFATSIAASGAEQTSLAGVALGEPVTEVVARYGPPDLVATTDDGLEWRWFDARGIDVDLLADNTLAVRQILAARPRPANGVAPRLVQPLEFPVLEMTASTADAWMRSTGGVRQSEPENVVHAFRFGSDVVVLEMRDGAVGKILAMDDASAVRVGYLGGPAGEHYQAPRLTHQFAVDYPKRALERRAQGVVVVAVDLLPSGAVKDARVLVSSGDGDIDGAELLSMRRSTFSPARCDGESCNGLYVDREEYSLPP